MNSPPLSLPIDLEYLWVFIQALKAGLEAVSPAPNEVKVGGYLIFQDTDGSLKIRDPAGGVTPLVIKT